MHIYIQQQVATDEEEILNKVAVMDYKEELPKFDLKLDFSFWLGTPITLDYVTFFSFGQQVNSIAPFLYIAFVRNSISFQSFTREFFPQWFVRSSVFATLMFITFFM